MIFVLLPFYFPCRVFVVTDLQSKQGWKVPLETTRVQDSPQSKAARSESLGFCLGKFKAFPKVKIPQHFQLQYLITLMLKIFLLIFYWNFPYSSVCLLPLIPPQCSSGKSVLPSPSHLAASGSNERHLSIFSSKLKCCISLSLLLCT